MTSSEFVALLNGSGLTEYRFRDWDVGEDGDWEGGRQVVSRFTVSLHESNRSDLIVMHRLTASMLAAGCTSLRLVPYECGSGDEVSTGTDLVAEFPCP